MKQEGKERASKITPCSNLSSWQHHLLQGQVVREVTPASRALSKAWPSLSPLEHQGSHMSPLEHQGSHSPAWRCR